MQQPRSGGLTAQSRHALPGQRGRLIFINRYFHPDHSATSQMLSDLAFALAQRGERVCVIASRQRYDAPHLHLPAREAIGGVDVRRVATTRFGRHRIIGRALDYFTFYLSSAWALWRLARTGDIVVAKTDPPMLGITAGPIARLRGAAFVNWLQDIFPEVAQASGMGESRFARFAFRVLGAIRNKSLTLAARTVVLGERMAARTQALGLDAASLRIIPNWADGASIRPLPPDENALRDDWALRGKFVIGYSGNLGRAHDYATLIRAIEITERGDISGARPQIAWLFIGGGASSTALQAEIKRLGLNSVQFRDYQPRARLAESLSCADIHLVSLLPECEGYVVPSKIYGIAAAGRPAIFIGDGDGEIARMLAKDRFGHAVSPGDGAALAALIAQLARDPQRVLEMGRNARAAFERNYGLDRAVASWEALLGEVRREAVKQPLAQPRLPGGQYRHRPDRAKMG